jgi:two-component system response regulator RegA
MTDVYFPQVTDFEKIYIRHRRCRSTRGLINLIRKVGRWLTLAARTVPLSATYSKTPEIAIVDTASRNANPPSSTSTPTSASTHPSTPAPTATSSSKILVVDDDQIFRTRLVRALTSRGFETHQATNYEEAIVMARRVSPERVVVDMRMPGRSGTTTNTVGLDLITELARIDPDIDIVVLTGYGSIATAVEAVRRGARDYLTKPVDTDQILQAFEKDPEGGNPVNESIPSLARVEWEHIQRILSDCGGNISQAARKLGIHRRSLQRKLGKLPPLE